MARWFTTTQQTAKARGGACAQVEVCPVRSYYYLGTSNRRRQIIHTTTVI